MPEVQHGRFVNLEKTDEGNLRIVLNRNGARVFAQIEEIRDRLGIDSAIRILLGEFFKRNWQEIKPEEIGALTSAVVITDQAERDAQGRLTSLGRVYWNQMYQVQDEIEELRERAAVLFPGVE